MKATNSKIKINSVAGFGEFISFEEPSVEIKSDYDFTKNWSQYYRVQNKKTQNKTVQVASSVHTLAAHKAEIEKLQNKVKQLQYEKSILVKWLHFLY